MRDLVPAERIEKRILLLRGHKVLLDGDLTELYESVAGCRERLHGKTHRDNELWVFSPRNSVITTAIVSAKEKQLNV